MPQYHPTALGLGKAQIAFQRAVAIAHQQSDQAMEMQALVAAACVDFTNCHFEKSLERNRAAIELAGRVDQLREESHARYDLASVSLAVGDLEEATRHANAFGEPAERSGSNQMRVNSISTTERIHSASGDWQAGRSFSEQGLAVFQRAPNLLGTRTLLEYQTGNLEAGEEYLDRLLNIIEWDQSGPITPTTFFPVFTIPAVVIPAAAYIAGTAKRFEEAEALAQSVLSWQFAHPGPSYAVRLGQALMAVQREDIKTAPGLYESLVPIHGAMWPQGPLGPGMSTDRVLGLLSHGMGTMDQAASHFEDALAFCRRAGYRPELAWTFCDYADMLKERDAEGDREKAVQLLDESLAISSELGMRPLMERVLSRREILKA